MASSTQDHDLGRSFWVGLVAGAPLIVYGVWWLFHNARITRPAGWARWFVGAAVIHDLVFAPIVIGGGLLASRFAPRWLRAPMQVATVFVGVTVIVAYPAATENGLRPSNPTLLPRDEIANLIAVVAAILVATGVWAALRWRASRAP